MLAYQHDGVSGTFPVSARIYLTLLASASSNIQKNWPASAHAGYSHPVAVDVSVYCKYAAIMFQAALLLPDWIAGEPAKTPSV